ncbi:hypothetical protein GHT06_006266 [Daphnia sinensis]|uniref:Retrotransposon gag domain-containing protein n=1 Tax=Daphnia sinensis TaxID=1820382 RepID=A0AAD5L1L5_9CRUS|nr:hypothetical protein GHT06_006266 [Daphnia sinensis]
MGVTHDEDSTTSAPQQWGGSTTPQAIPPTASTSQGLPSQFLNTNSKAHVTDPDEEEAIKKMSKFVTNPIVKATGDLFSREDKKEIPTYKGKSTDKLITEWLKGAEHVARNNDWNDDQKIRLFSDRLKGEAFEWHENYAEEEGDNLNYPDWKEAIIARFQDKVDLATLENKFSKLKQKPEENCRAFVSRLNSLHDTIEGKEEKSDHNQTIAEGQLLHKLRKVRDKRKKKVLLQGLLPKYRKELFLRMPDDPEDFDALCKQLFLSEKILHTKEETEDDDMSAVIAGITKHQDEKFQLLEQKLTESLTEIKLSNTKCGSSQDKLTIAAVDLNDRRRSNSRDSRVRFASSREPFRERSASRNRDNSPYRRNYNTSEQRHQNSSERQDYRPPERQDYTPAGYIQPRYPSDQRKPYRSSYPTRQGDYNGPSFPINSYGQQGPSLAAQNIQSNTLPNLIRIPIKIFNKEIRALVDTGAAASLVSDEIFNTLENRDYIKRKSSIDSPIFRTVSGQVLKSIGKFEFTIRITNNHMINHYFYVMKGLNEECILGLDFLTSNNVKLTPEIGKYATIVTE